MIFRKEYWILALGSLLLCSAVACEDDANDIDLATGAHIVANVDPNFAGEVSTIEIAVSGGGISGKITAFLTRGLFQWRGTIREIPSGADRTFHVRAFDKGGLPVGESVVDGVEIMRGRFAEILVYLKESGPPIPPAEGNVSPVIDGLSAGASFVFPKERLSVSASAHDPNAGDTPIYFWIADGGEFDNQTLQTTVWTAPEEIGEYEIQIWVGDGNSGIATRSMAIEVVNFPSFSW